MADITLLAESGRTIGSRPARRLRADGRIPGVLYGPGVAPISPDPQGVVARHIAAVSSRRPLMIR